MKLCYCLIVYLISSSVVAQINTTNDSLALEKANALYNDSTTKTNSKSFSNLMKKSFEINKDSTIFGLEEEKDPTIDLLIQDYIENKKFLGYRIQIYAANERWEAVKVRSEFLKKYPEEKSYLVYQAPNFKVRIGDYQNRFVTQEHLEIIKIDFPSAFVVKDEIEPLAK